MNLKAWFKQNKTVLLLLTFLVLVAYFNSLGNDFVSDDIGAIRDHPHLNKVSYFWKPPYFNMSLRGLIIFLTHKLFGLNPLFYRLSNILFHFDSTWLIFLLTGFFFSSPIPFFTASIFAVHPLLTESITWISGGPYSNGTFFFLLAFLTYILLVTQKKFKLYLPLLFFYLTLLFSEKFIVFPLILLLYELSLGNLKKNWPKLIPFWLIAGFWSFCLLGLLGPRISALETTFYQEPKIYNPLVQIPIAVTSYLELIFWPKNLTLYHSEMIFSQTQYLVRLGVFILFLALIVYFFKKDRRIFFWLSFFLISLLPTLTPLGISWIVAERYVYLGSIGIFAIVAVAIQRLGTLLTKDTSGMAERTPPRWTESQTVSLLILVPILVLLSFRTIARNADWKNQDTLWLATAKTSPSSPQNHNNLGDYYGRHGDFQSSIEEFQMAIKLNPRYADAYHNLANTYQQIGEVDKAIENYKKSLEFGSHLWQSHQALAAIFFDQEKYEQALPEIEKAILINPQNSNLYVNLAVVYLKLNDSQNAQNALNTALQLDPQNRQAKELLYEIKKE